MVELILALCCMMIIFLPDIIGRQSDDGSETDDTTWWRGNIIALLTGTLLAVYISIVRKGGKSSKDIRLTGAAALGGALSAFISIIVRMGDVLPTAYWRGEGRELWQYWCGAVAQGGGVGIFRVTMSIAPRLLTGAEIGLALLLETFFGPIWVFLAYGDAPSTWTLIGGSALLVILAVHESWPLLKKAHRVTRRMVSMFASTTPPGEGNISGMWNGLQEEPAIDNLCANHHAQYEFIKTEQ